MKPWKLQKLAGDVVYDLRSRGLLPVAALLIVAMVVLPVLISRQSNEPPPADGAALADAATLAPENQTAVLAYSPGVRDYRKRLDSLKEKDPFVQHFQGGSGSAGSGEGSGAADPSASTAGGAPGTSAGSGSGGGGGTIRIVPGKTQKFVISHRMDVSVGEAGKMKRRNNVPLLSFLPGKVNPVVVFMGIGAGGDKATGGKALFLVSSDVTAVSGDGGCLAGSGNPCEYLVLGVGETAGLDYAANGKRYRLKVVAIRRVVKRLPDSG